jgi:hypothetical protein
MKLIQAITLVASFVQSPGWHMKSPNVMTGVVKHYGPELMAKVALNRGYIDSIDDYDEWLESEGVQIAIATMRKGDIGRKGLLHINGHKLRFIVIDCAQRKHYKERIRRNDAAEISYETAEMVGTAWNTAIGCLLFDCRFKVE